MKMSPIGLGILTLGSQLMELLGSCKMYSVAEGSLSLEGRVEYLKVYTLFSFCFSISPFLGFMFAAENVISHLPYPATPK